MSLADIFPWVTGAGGALAVLLIGMWFFITGRIMPAGTHKEIVADKDKQISNLNLAVLRERERADAAMVAAETTREIVQALHREARR